MTSSHRDLEMRWFYGLCTGVPASFAVLFACMRIAGSDNEWWGSTGLAFGALVFAYLGPPLKAEVRIDGTVRFYGLLRRRTMTVQNVVRIKVPQPRDSITQPTVRCRRQVPFLYRVDKFTDAGPLAAAVLRLLDRSPSASVDPMALERLRKTAQHGK